MIFYKNNVNNIIPDSEKYICFSYSIIDLYLAFIMYNILNPIQFNVFPCD